ncbi:MAG: recombinase family protein [Candidatus Methanomethylophilaceae archaeon]|nr:recombinase family protein [Candidatus Methanomethylophilaceae archaeon]
MDEDKNYRAAIYVRVSTDEQAQDGYSLNAQKEMLTNYCISQGWNIAKFYEDDGYSGRTVKRPAYAKMIEESDLWDVMLVVKMDRIHRNSRNFMEMMEDISSKGKMFVSSTEALDTTNALGRFVVDMIQRIAQLESEQIGERTYFGMREKAENLENDASERKTMGFNPPFGYRISNGALEAVRDELDVAENIFFQYYDGRTIDEICSNLNEEETLTRKGNIWNKFNLSNILHNPVYAGYMRWEDVLIRHEAHTAVSPELFNRVQEIMASKVKDPSKRNVLLVPVIGEQN